MFKKLFSLTMAIGIFTSLLVQPTFASSSFSDVDSKHWASSAIQWAVENKVASGYPDGTFRPGNNVTEAEFLAMLIRAFYSVSTPSDVKHWADPIYKYAVAKNWPITGSSLVSARNKVITRGSVAEIIAGSQGINVSQTSAVQFLLNEGYSNGKVGPTVAGYKPNDFLNRAETVEFIKRLKDAGVKELETRPTLPGGEVPTKPDVTMPPETKKVNDALNKAITGNPKYSGYEAKAAESDTTVAYKDKQGVLVGYTDTEGSAYANIDIFKAKDANIRELVYVMLKAAGVKVTDEIKKAIEDATTAKVAKDSKIDNSNVEINIRPHPTNPDRIAISFKVK